MGTIDAFFFFFFFFFLFFFFFHSFFSIPWTCAASCGRPTDFSPALSTPSNVYMAFSSRLLALPLPPAAFIHPTSSAPTSAYNSLSCPFLRIPPSLPSFFSIPLSLSLFPAKHAHFVQAKRRRERQKRTKLQPIFIVHRPIFIPLNILADHMIPYSTQSLYPAVPYMTEDLQQHAHGDLSPSSPSDSPPNGQLGNTNYAERAISGDYLASALAAGAGNEQVSLSAEEDRRRRNTAASARFRMKKKQREQTLEKTVRETTERNAALEARVAQLEVENRWLKNLVTEKHEVSTTRTAQPSATGDQKANSIPGSGQKHIQPKKRGVGTGR